MAIPLAYGMIADAICIGNTPRLGLTECRLIGSHFTGLNFRYWPPAAARPAPLRPFAVAQRLDVVEKGSAPEQAGRMSLIVGIDPGLSGAFAVLSAVGEVIAVDDLPIIRVLSQ